MEFMRHLHDHVNIIPLLAKSDSMTQEEIAKLKVTIREQINAGQIKIYDFPKERKMKEVIPFAVVGSNIILEVDGKATRGRKYPWGVVNIENSNHSDFSLLRNMLVANMMDIKDVTNIHYENYRCRKLAGILGPGNVNEFFFVLLFFIVFVVDLPASNRGREEGICGQVGQEGAGMGGGV